MNSVDVVNIINFVSESAPINTSCCGYCPDEQCFPMNNVGMKGDSCK